MGILKKVAIGVFCLDTLFGAALGLGGYSYYDGVKVDFPASREAFKQSLYTESKVSYSNGRPFSSLAGLEKYRNYVKLEDIPQACVDTLIATEDKRFFEHNGFDLIATSRALLTDLEEGKLKEGGSTITQQLAKNSFSDLKGKSLERKVKELKFAFWLEENFSKKEILEYYFNQIHVISSQVGLSNAARYFFNKDVKNLDTTECAFLVGMVKAPRNYDPFDSKNIQKAQERTIHALHRLEEFKGKDYSDLIEKIKTDGIHFNKGASLTFKNSSLVDIVGRELNFEIENPATAGLNIITTIDENKQKVMEYATKTEISLIDIGLRGYQKISGNSLTNSLKPSEFGYSQITRVGGDFLEVRSREGRIERIEKESLDRTARADKTDVGEFLSQFKDGDTIYLSKNLDGKLVLEQKPSLEIASVLLDQDGAILALMGSYDNTNFNNIFDGERPVGSVFKPFLTYAALNAGWFADDLLSNKAWFQDFKGSEIKVYAPHNYNENLEGQSSDVKLEEALVKSLNIPHVYLLYHLAEKQPKELAERVDLVQRKDESQIDYQKRLEQEGIFYDESYLNWLAFEKAKAQLSVSTEKEKKALENLVYDKTRYSPEEDNKRSNEIFSQLLDYSQIMKMTDHCKLEDIKAFLISKSYDLNSLSTKKLNCSVDGKNISFTVQGLENLDDFGPKNIFIEDISPSSLENIKQVMEQKKADNVYSLDSLVQDPRFMLRVGEKYLVETAKRFGLDNLDPNPSMALGAQAINPLKFVTSFQDLLEGKIVTPYIVKEVKDNGGESLYQADSVPKEVDYYNKEKELAVNPVIKLLLKDVTKVGTAGIVNRTLDGALKDNVGGKTGTTNDYRDAWFVGYYTNEGKTYYLLTWLGSHQKDGEKGMGMEGREIKVVGSTAAKIWGEEVNYLSRK